jgi:PIN domain nuclease of toxin-antitoxin system
VRPALDASALLVYLLRERGSDAVEAARLRPLAVTAGLSLGDRCCLAQAARLGSAVLTSDQDWRELDLPVEVRVFR